MSFKIHKALGYGLTGLTVHDGKLVDPIINHDAPGITWHDDDENGKWSYPAWQDYLSKHPNPDSGLLHSLANFIRRNSTNAPDLFRHVIHSVEGGDPGTVLIVPPGLYQQNFRFNSVIDQHESVVRQGESMDPIVDVLPYGMSPWGGWMRKDTMEELEGDANTIANWIYLEASSDEKAAGYLALAKVLGLPSSYSADEIKALIIPEIPYAIKVFTDWLGLFTNDNGWQNLRPMVYTYWS